MATIQNYSIYAGDSEPLSMVLTGYDSITAINLASVLLTGTPPATGIDVLFKSRQADPDRAARISKSLLIETITITGTPTGGNWTITVGGLTTADIPYNATATQVKTALELLASVGAGNSIVQGGPGPGTPWAICLIGAAAGQAITVAQSIGSPFTGGSSPAIAGVAAGGGVTIVSAVNGQIAVKIVSADTQGVQAQLQLEGTAKAFLVGGDEITGWTGLLTVSATDVQAT